MVGLVENTVPDTDKTSELNSTSAEFPDFDVNKEVLFAEVETLPQFKQDPTIFLDQSSKEVLLTNNLDVGVFTERAVTVEELKDFMFGRSAAGGLVNFITTIAGQGQLIERDMTPPQGAVAEQLYSELIRTRNEYDADLHRDHATDAANAGDDNRRMFRLTNGTRTVSFQIRENGDVYIRNGRRLNQSSVAGLLDAIGEEFP